MGESRKAAVGAFVVAGLVLFGLGLFMIGDRRQLFDESFEVHAAFQRLAGLQNGALVRVAGMEAGEVEAIGIPDSPEAPFLVQMRIVSKLRPLVRANSVATIQTDGIVGNKFVDIGSGTAEAEIVEDGGAIESREPFELADVMQRAMDIAATLDTSIRDLRDDAEAAFVTLADAVTRIDGVVERIDGVVESVGGELEVMADSAREIMADAEAMVEKVRAGEGSIGRLVNDEALYEQSVAVVNEVRGMSEDAAVVLEKVREISEEASAAIEDFKAGGGPAPGVIADLTQTIEFAREAMSDLAENMESAKRSFLFRGLFQDRGFFDLDSLTVAEYLEDGLGKDHRSLRQWIPRDALLAGDGEAAQLSELGKARIDSAMREILLYPQNSPIMVEGYDAMGSLEERFLRARRLAYLVHDYIVRKYHRNPNYTSFIPLESIPPVAMDVDGDELESGVVLALYYDEDIDPAPRHRIVH